MHELSIASSLVDIATEHALAEGAAKVHAITLQVGALSCIHQDALQFSFELVTEGTILEGASLQIEQVPVTIFCSRCDQEVELPGIQNFRCPNCGQPSGDIRRGKELDILSIEISDSPSPPQPPSEPSHDTTPHP